MLMMTVFWVAVILLLFAALRNWSGQNGGRPADTSGSQDRALTILRERYARGEIDRDEYEARRRALDEPIQSG
jgi:putative membrane protein